MHHIQAECRHLGCPKNHESGVIAGCGFKEVRSELCHVYSRSHGKPHGGHSEMLQSNRYT